MMLEIKQTATFQKWEHALKDSRAKAAIAARIFRLANGLAGDVTPVGQGVSELRIHHGPGYRVYFRQQGHELIILLRIPVKVGHPFRFKLGHLFRSKVGHPSERSDAGVFL
jgi:putative addiction module killer protein